MSPGDITAVWAEEQVTSLLPGGAEAPEYGSLAWARLPAGDPRKAAAIITAAELWRRYVGSDDLGAWLLEATAPRPPLHTQPSGEELATRRQHRAPHQLRATPGWPPIAIPGRPGRYLVVAQEAAA